jgi:hypothetical protein
MLWRGLRFLWTRSVGRRKRVGRHLAAGEVEKVRRETDRHAKFTASGEQIVEVNEQIREATHVSTSTANTRPRTMLDEGVRRTDDIRWQQPQIVTPLRPGTDRTRRR